MEDLGGECAYDGEFARKLTGLTASLHIMLVHRAYLNKDAGGFHTMDSVMNEGSRVTASGDQLQRSSLPLS